MNARAARKWTDKALLRLSRTTIECLPEPASVLMTGHLAWRGRLLEMRGAILRHGLVLDASRQSDVIHTNGAPSPPERFAGGPDRAGGGDFRLPR